MKPTGVAPYTTKDPQDKCRTCGTPASSTVPLVRQATGFRCAGGSCRRRPR